MEFLLIWVLAGDVIDSALRYQTAAKCFSEAQNAANKTRDDLGHKIDGAVAADDARGGPHRQ